MLPDSDSAGTAHEPPGVPSRHGYNDTENAIFIRNAQIPHRSPLQKALGWNP